MRFWVAFLLALLLPASALAVGQGEASLSLGGGMAVRVQGEAQPGIAAELRILRGVSDAWAARLGLQATLCPSTEDRSAGSVLSQAAGLTWAMDIVNWVPFVDLGLLLADVRGGGSPASQRLGAQAGLGVDYYVSRRTVLSLLGRIDYLPLRLAGSESARPFVASFVLHLGRAF
jgi:hypothetical protein